MKKSNLTATLRTTTWARDSHGLYDYDSKNISKVTHTTNYAGTIYRANNEIQLDTSGEYKLEEKEHVLVGKLNYSDGIFSLWPIVDE